MTAKAKHPPKVNFRFSSETLKQLDSLCREEESRIGTRVSRSSWVRMAIYREYLKSKGK